MASSPGPRLAG
jgi:NAD(P)-dependent dehydrogenase (short-subunit alcohol dehydrogenase family)